MPLIKHAEYQDLKTKEHKLQVKQRLIADLSWLSGYKWARQVYEYLNSEYAYSVGGLEELRTLVLIEFEAQAGYTKKEYKKLEDENKILKDRLNYLESIAGRALNEQTAIPSNQNS